MSVLIIIEVILAFGFMIFIHEGGHYLACRWFKVDVDEFALGFGPILVSRKWGRTLYSIRAIPLGGFCKPAGGDLSGQSAEEMYAKPAQPGEFLFASWWKRVVIFLAGPSMNYLSTFLILFVLFAVIGQKIPQEKPVLGFIPPGSLAEKAGFQKGDRILQVGDKPVATYYEALETLDATLAGAGASGTAALTVDRKGARRTLSLKGEELRSGAELGFHTQLPPVVGSVPLGTPARKAGLKEGDKILSVNGNPVSEWAQMAYFIRESKPTGGEDLVALEVLRDGKTHPVTLKRVFDGMGKRIGISALDEGDYRTERMGPATAFVASGKRTWELTRLFSESLFKLFTGQISLKDNLAGPVTIMRLMYERAAQHWSELLGVVAFISLILCLMNLLPIPVVDGGQIVLCLIEGIKRGPVSIKAQNLYQQVGFFLVIGLMALAVFNDFWGLFLEKFRSQIN